MPTSELCPRCKNVGIQTRLKRVYYRLDGRYSEIGWICPSCMNFFVDWASFVDDYNRIFETTDTVEDFKEKVAWVNKRISSLERLESQKPRKSDDSEPFYLTEKQIAAFEHVSKLHGDSSIDKELRKRIRKIDLSEIEPHQVLDSKEISK